MHSDPLVDGLDEMMKKPRRKILGLTAVEALIAANDDILTPVRENFNCPGRKKEDPSVKAKKKASARNQKINRLRAGKKRKFSSHHKK